MLSLKHFGLCGLVLFPYSVYATSTLAFCKKAGEVNDADWFAKDDCKQVANWAEGVCYAAPADFAKKGAAWKVTEAPAKADMKCRVFVDKQCQKTSGNGNLVSTVVLTDDILAFACYGPAYQKDKKDMSMPQEDAITLPDVSVDASNPPTPPSTVTANPPLSSSVPSSSSAPAAPSTGGSSASTFVTISASMSGASRIEPGGLSGTFSIVGSSSASSTST